jgi:hypothetical protein
MYNLFTRRWGQNNYWRSSSERTHWTILQNSVWSRGTGGISVEDDFWSSQEILSVEEAEELVQPFTMLEIKAALKDMDSNFVLGPDGLSIGFYKKMWPHIKGVIFEMFSKLHLEKFNMSRLNYDLITLIPKLKEANNIKQFRPICLLNVDYKWFTKVLTMRLTKYANKLISPTQTTFIP